MKFEPVIGLEIHAELETQSKMFCGCPLIDVTKAKPNTSVCPICSGMPGTLPVINQRAVEFALKVALALECEITPLSIFARKNYFYPDLPKGFQISQYEQPLARNGHLIIWTSKGERKVRIRRVHLEEDTGKLTHVEKDGHAYSLIDLNRAGVPLLEIVSEPDLHSSEEVRLYAVALRSLLRYLGVNSGDMQKGVLRIEPNVSVRLPGSSEFGTRTEIKNLNSFRALERSVAFEIERQSRLIRAGGRVLQETRGWDERIGETVTQRVKEEADDYRYFPEPDLPPLVIESDWLERIKSDLPELPIAKHRRFQEFYALGEYDAAVLVEERAVADFFEEVVALSPGVSPKVISNWITGDLFGLMNQSGLSIDRIKVDPKGLAGLIKLISEAEINQTSAKSVLAEMFESGRSAPEIVSERGLVQISDVKKIEEIVDIVVESNPDQVADYIDGKATISRWFFGQAMRLTGGRANPQILDMILMQKLQNKKDLGMSE
jgi:aspartyl-tRNA(Asn)/glutamyl-tRNA(Gln) amidotransferase subunit B